MFQSHLLKILICEETKASIYEDNLGAIITTKLSSNQKYTSISILVTMESAEAIILKYQELSILENIISI